MVSSELSPGLAARADAARVRLTNGREIVAQTYWHAGRRVMLWVARGIVGVPRDLVASINGLPLAATIGTCPGAVNVAGGLSGSGRSVTLGRIMADKEACFDEAVDHVADGDLDAAIAAYRRALEIDPEFTDAIQGLAMAFADKEMFDEAITWGKRLVDLAPDETLAHTSLSMFYQRKGMIAEAEAEGAKARMLDWKRQLGEQKKDEEP